MRLADMMIAFPSFIAGNGGDVHTLGANLFQHLR